MILICEWFYLVVLMILRDNVIDDGISRWYIKFYVVLLKNEYEWLICISFN